MWLTVWDDYSFKKIDMIYMIHMIERKRNLHGWASGPAERLHEGSLWFEVAILALDLD